MPALNWLIVEHSWHWAFGALGLVGLAWVVLWLMFGREGSLVDPPVGAHSAAIERIPYRYLIFCPSIVAVCCAAFAVYWGLALGFTWFTAYLIDGLGFSQTMAGDLSILPWIFGMVAVLLGGLVSQHMQSRGVSTRICRGVFAAGTVTLGGCLVPFIFAMPTPGLKLALLVAGTSVGATIFVVLPMIVCELTPQPQRAAMLAITTPPSAWPAFWRRWSWDAWSKPPPRPRSATRRASSCWACCWWPAAWSACCSSSLKTTVRRWRGTPFPHLPCGQRAVDCENATAPVLRPGQRSCLMAPSPIERAEGVTAR